MNVRLKLQFLAKRLLRKLTNSVNRPRQVYLSNRIDQYRELWLALAVDMNANLRALDSDLWEIQKNHHKVRVRLHQLPIDNDVVLKLCGRKPTIHRMLQDAEIPSPLYEEFELDSIDRAYNFLTRSNGLVVVKPIDGYSAFGVTTHISKPSQLRSAAVNAALHSPKLMIEEQIAGECFRLLVYKKNLIHAVKRTGFRIDGDGKHSIRELIEKRGFGKKIFTDISFTLAAQGIRYSDVPESNENILISSVGCGFNGGAELRTVYDDVVTSLVSDEIRADVERCASIVDSDFLGVDIITCDITKDLRATGGVVNEINTTPALHHHYDYPQERYPPFLKDILKDLMR
ncbi:hypothetical protein [Aurantivibrio infirmus]